MVGNHHFHPSIYKTVGYLGVPGIDFSLELLLFSAIWARFKTWQWHNHEKLIGVFGDPYSGFLPSLKLTAKAPENRPNPQKETHLPTSFAIHFQVRTVSFREGILCLEVGNHNPLYKLHKQGDTTTAHMFFSLFILAVRKNLSSPMAAWADVEYPLSVDNSKSWQLPLDIYVLSGGK